MSRAVFRYDFWGCGGGEWKLSNLGWNDLLNGRHMSRIGNVDEFRGFLSVLSFRRPSMNAIPIMSNIATSPVSSTSQDRSEPIQTHQVSSPPTPYDKVETYPNVVLILLT